MSHEGHDNPNSEIEENLGDSAVNEVIIQVGPPPPPTTGAHLTGEHLKNRKKALYTRIADPSHDLPTFGDSRSMSTEFRGRYYATMIDRVSSIMTESSREQRIMFAGGFLLLIFIVIMMISHTFYTLQYEAEFMPSETLVFGIPSSKDMLRLPEYHYMSEKRLVVRADQLVSTIISNNARMLNRSNRHCIYPSMYATEWNVLTVWDTNKSYVNTVFVPAPEPTPRKFVKIKGDDGSSRVISAYRVFNLTYQASFDENLQALDYKGVIVFNDTNKDSLSSMSVCIQSYFVFE